MATADYAEFLAQKRALAIPCGFDVSPLALNRKLFGFQRDIVLWALKRGKAAVFASTGLGKGPIQLEWTRMVAEKTKRPSLIAAPLAVAQQFQREAAKFEVSITLCREDSDVRDGVNVTNYERLDKFDLDRFAGVSLDESSCIKDWTSKTAQSLISRLAKTPYKLACSATPSPNEHAELGTHAELLDVMRRAVMLAMFFEHDGGETSKWVLKGHGKKPFWHFMASWAVCVKWPSDLGYPDDGYNIPPLNMQEHIVQVDHSEATDGMLFRCPDMSATGLHRELRLTINARAKRVAELVAEKPHEQWLIWTNTNYESDAIAAHVPDVVSIRGSDSPDKKEKALMAFSDGAIRRLETKGEIAGFGMNWQQCANMTIFQDYSFEKMFQIVRRCWRFGQTRTVNAHLVIGETEGPVLKNIQRKAAQYEELQSEMNAAMREEQLKARYQNVKYDHEMAMEIPVWLT